MHIIRQILVIVLLGIEVVDADQILLEQPLDLGVVEVFPEFIKHFQNWLRVRINFIAFRPDYAALAETIEPIDILKAVDIIFEHSWLLPSYGV